MASRATIRCARRASIRVLWRGHHGGGRYAEAPLPPAPVLPRGRGALAYCLLGEPKGIAMMFRVSPKRRLRKLTRLRRHLEASDIAGAVVPEALMLALKPAARAHAGDGALRAPVPA